MAPFSAHYPGSMKPPRKLHIKSYGCQMNVYDAQRMVDTLAPEGFVETASAEDADLVILNPCHIREKASEKVYSELGRLRVAKDEAARNGRKMDVVVAGCVAQAEGNEIIRRAPVVDVVVGPQSYHHLPQLLARAKNHGRALETEFPVEDKFGFLAPPKPDAIRARGISSFVTVQEGCDKFCTFCVVPYTRGTEVSRPVAKIVDDVLRLADHGVREITLIGQNVNAYHGEGPGGRTWSLGTLLHRLPDTRPARGRREADRRPPRSSGPDAVRAPSGTVRLRPDPRGDEPQAYRRRLPPRHRPISQRSARYCVFIGFYRRLSRRNRGRFRSDPRTGHTNRLRWRLFVQIFAPARDA